MKLLTEGHRAGYGNIFNGWHHQTLRTICPNERHPSNGPGNLWSQSRCPGQSQRQMVASTHSSPFFFLNIPNRATTHFYHSCGTISMLTIYLGLMAFRLLLRDASEAYPQHTSSPLFSRWLISTMRWQVFGAPVSDGGMSQPCPHFTHFGSQDWNNANLNE